MNQHLLNVSDFSTDEIRRILDLADAPVAAAGTPLAGKGAALIFEKPSTRTRHSMEMAVVQLGGHPVYTRGEEVGLDSRETVEDLTRILAGYHGVVAARVFEHSLLERMAAVGEVPIVNMLSEWSHPLQAFADALTMEQALGDLTGRIVAWIGDYNNVARSLGEITVLLGATVRFACPPDFSPDVAELERLNLLAGSGSATLSSRPVEAVEGASAVHTDTWVSMGQEDDKEARRRAFEGFTVDETLMASADPKAIFMHCLPAYRGLEVTADVIDGPQSVVFAQGHNRLHAARAALSHILGAT
jgi:ornithine carbamoyltransferase